MNTPENAANAVASFDMAEAGKAADEMAAAFELAGNRISEALQNAAQTGELSFSQMTESISQDLARLAVQELVTAPLESAFNAMISNVFKASSSTQSPMNVTLNLSGAHSVQDFKKSETQISAGLARALSQGRKLI